MSILKFAKKNRPNLEIPWGRVLMQFLLSQQIPVASSCKGEGVCGKCRMMIISGAEFLSPMSEEEKRVIDKLGYPAGTRLSCQARITGDEGSEITIDTGYW